MNRRLLTLALLMLAFCAAEISAQSFQTGKIAVTLSQYGRVRVFKDSLAGLRQIDRSSFLSGVSPERVFSYKLSANTLDTFKTLTNPTISDFEVYGSVDNSYDTTTASPDLVVKHNVYGWTNQGYLLVKFTVINRESAALSQRLGMEIIPQVDGSYGLETAKYLSGPGIISIFRLPTSTYTGYKLVSAPMTSIRFIDWYSGYNDTNATLYSHLAYNQIDTLIETGGDGAVLFFSQSPVSVNSNDSTTMWVAIAVGNDEAEMVSNMALAVTKYSTLTDINEKSVINPDKFDLSQNYPNPFNPETIIDFNLIKSGFITLKVYDILGNEIQTLASGYYEAGKHSVRFTAENFSGGVYFYKLTSGSASISRKMILNK